ncbi:MAG: hypothetical protein J0L93_09970 [Deltaproteobacteria bacterium]|nr:hypothetical protein [Deltaproteobacteria bacterium]
MSGFRVACEFQVRFRTIEESELEVFRSYAMRPSAYSALKSQIENQLSAMAIRDESKNLLEKAFQILLNIDQRLERIEEQMYNPDSSKYKILENYDWVHGELGAKGLSFSHEKTKSVKVGDLLLLDLILPSLPEQRMVAALKVSSLANDYIDGNFVAIHDEDVEFLHRYVIAREREMLRARALERDRQKTEE